jgi:hypothetical protein
MVERINGSIDTFSRRYPNAQWTDRGVRPILRATPDRFSHLHACSQQSASGEGTRRNPLDLESSAGDPFDEYTGNVHTSHYARRERFHNRPVLLDNVVNRQ